METRFDTEFIDDEIDNQPYLEPFAQSALKEWFKANDSIEPVFESRADWEKRESMLEKSAEEDEKQTLYLPEDLNLSEMIDVVKVVDEDTFGNNPQRSKDGVQRLEKLAETFKKAGVYIDSNTSNIVDGKDIATELSRKFYNYGLTLQTNINHGDADIKPVMLSEDDKKELDKWLIGDERYYKVMSRLGPNPSSEEIERERERHFKGYFKALSLEGSKGVTDKYWDRNMGPVAMIHAKTEQGIKREVSEPDTEVYRAVFRKGKERVKTEMNVQAFEKVRAIRNGQLGIYLMEQHEKLYDTLKIPELKKELEEVKSKGNIEEISKKEIEIAGKIRDKITTAYQYKDLANNPSEIIKDNYLNCLGSTLLGTSLLDELGIKYLYTESIGHILTFLVTSNKKLYWQDFTPGNDVRMKELGDIFEGSPDILALAENLKSFSVFVPSNKDTYTFSNSADAIIAILANNMSAALDYDESIKLYELALKLNPNDPCVYNNLAFIYCNHKEYDKALELGIQGMGLNPSNSYFYSLLGEIYMGLEKYDKSIEILNKGLEIDPNDSNLYKDLADVYMELQDADKAIDFCYEGLKLKPKDPDLLKKLDHAVRMSLAKLKYRR